MSAALLRYADFGRYNSFLCAYCDQDFYLRTVVCVDSIFGWENKIMANESEKLNELMDRSLMNISGLADVNTIIGKPITTASGFQIIPFSKVVFGNLSGGGEYGDEKLAKQRVELPFAGGNGTIVMLNFRQK